MKKILLILVSILALNSQTMAYEEVNYEVVKENQKYEIRKYPDRLVIETNSIKGNGFRKLFNYISGNNEKNQEINMTVPVTQEIKNGNMTMQFYLPSKFNKDNTPKPSNSEIKVFGKEVGNDFYDGKITLPIILLFQKTNNIEKQNLKDIFKKNKRTKNDLEFTLKLILKYDIINQCYKKAEHFINLASNSLSIFPSSEEKKVLENLTSFSLERSF